MRAEKEIFSKKEFDDFTMDRLIVYKADFPQRKILNKKIQSDNDVLADKFNSQGIFPYFVLMRPDETVITSFSYDNESLEAFKKRLNANLSNEQAGNVQTSK